MYDAVATETAQDAPRREPRAAKRWRIDPATVWRGFVIVDAAAAAVILGLWAVAACGTLAALQVKDAAPLLAMAFLFAAAFREGDVYRFDATLGGRAQALRALGALAIAWPFGVALGGTAGALFGEPFVESAIAAGVAGALCAAGLVALHGAWGFFSFKLARRGVFSLNVVLIGATATARQILQRNRKTGEFNILGVFDDRLARSPADVEGAPVLGGLDALLAWPALPSVDRIIVTVSSTAHARVLDLVNRLKVAPNTVVLLLDVYGFDPQAITLAEIADQPAAYVSGRPADARRAFWKRVQDIGIGSILLAIALPIMALVALAIRLESPGPIFFRQPRHGFNNQTIKVWKFRSMRPETADLRAAKQVTKDDPRVTKVGKFIRRTSLDELPQLFNVLAGEMSLVGPRPHAIGMMTGDVESATLIWSYAHRHRIKPGMTGWAQVNGSRGPIDTPEEVHERVRLDLEYVDRASFWWDMWIILITLPCLLGDSQKPR